MTWICIASIALQQAKVLLWALCGFSCELCKLFSNRVELVSGSIFSRFDYRFSLPESYVLHASALTAFLHQKSMQREPQQNCRLCKLKACNCTVSL